MMTNLLNGAHVANKLFSTIARLRLLLVMFVALSVSANVWGADVTLSSSTITSGKKLAYASEWTYTANNVSWSGYCYTDANSRPWIQLKKDKGVYVKIVTPSGSKITQLKVTITSSSNSSGGVTDITKHTDFSGRVALLTEDAAGSTTMTGVAYATTVSNDIATLNPSGNNNTLYLKVSGGARIWSMTVTYETAAASCNPITPSLSYTPSSLSVGGTANPTLTGNSGNGSVTYSSSNTSVATVNASTGVVTAKAAGTTTITATIAANNGYCEGTATANVTVTANPYTVTLDAGSGTCAESVTEPNAGEGVTLPTPTLDGCDEWRFAGWKTTSAVTTETTTEPTLIPAGAYSPTSDITLYAVYQRTETIQGGGSGNYELVTSAPSDWSGTYLIVDGSSKNCFNGSLTSPDAGGNYTSVTISDNTITSNTTTDSYSVTISKSTTNGKYYIKTASGYYIGSTASTSSDGNELKSSTSTKYDNSISISSNNVTIKGPDHILKFFYQSGQSWRFRFYKSTTTQNVRLPQLYKKSSGSSSTTYYHSTPDCGITEPSRCVTPKCGDDSGGTWLVVSEW